MKFLVVGVNHENLSMDQRNAYHFHESDKLSFSTLLLDEKIDQTLILSTCNRSEVYVICDDYFDENQLKEMYLSYFHQSNPHILLKKDEDALLHLLEVACGLQSMVLGEDQILHQIKDALSFTIQQKLGGKELYFIFQNVISFAKEMRHLYAISEHPLSVSYIGYQSIKELLQPGDKIMICGIGEMARLMIEYLKDYEIFLVNRTYENVKPYLSENIHYVPFDFRYCYVSDVRVLISATSSPHILFKKELIEDYQNKIYLDLALPRDIDPQMKSDSVFIDMDELQQRASYHLEKRKEICELIRKECHCQVHKLRQGLKMMKSDTLIQKMQTKYLDVSQETYELLRHKIELTSREDYILKKVLKASFLRLLKEPIQMIKNEDMSEYIDFVEKMLGDDIHE